MIGSSVSLKDYIKNIAKDVVSEYFNKKKIVLSTTSASTGETEGHKHSYTKVISASLEDKNWQNKNFLLYLNKEIKETN